MTSANDVRERAEDLQRHIAEGRILEAFDEFYAKDVVMQENDESPIRGFAANREREQQFLDSVAEWKRFEVERIAVDGDTAFVESAMAFRTKDGTDVAQSQVSRTRWRDGKIVDERFYHG